MMNDYMKWIAEEEERIAQLEKEWEELAREFTQSMLNAKTKEERKQIRDRYLCREESIELAQQRCVYRIHNHKKSMLMDELIENM